MNFNLEYERVSAGVFSVVGAVSFIDEDAHPENKQRVTMKMHVLNDSNILGPVLLDEHFPHWMGRSYMLGEFIFQATDLMRKKEESFISSVRNRVGKALEDDYGGASGPQRAVNELIEADRMVKVRQREFNDAGYNSREAYLEAVAAILQKPKDVQEGLLSVLKKGEPVMTALIQTDKKTSKLINDYHRKANERAEKDMIYTQEYEDTARKSREVWRLVWRLPKTPTRRALLDQIRSLKRIDTPTWGC